MQIKEKLRELNLKKQLIDKEINNLSSDYIDVALQELVYELRLGFDYYGRNINVYSIYPKEPPSSIVQFLQNYFNKNKKYYTVGGLQIIPNNQNSFYISTTRYSAFSKFINNFIIKNNVKLKLDPQSSRKITSAKSKALKVLNFDKQLQKISKK